MEGGGFLGGVEEGAVDLAGLFEVGGGLSEEVAGFGYAREEALGDVVEDFAVF